jgi:hypothetical protein
MKFLVLVLSIVLFLPIAAHSSDLEDKLVGTYSSTERGFVTLKRLTFERDKEGKLKLHGSLVGFPDEVSLGDAVPKLYYNKNSGAPTAVLATFSSEKYKPTVIINPNYSTTKGGVMSFSCYMHDVDGKDIWFTGNLIRE